MKKKKIIILALILIAIIGSGIVYDYTFNSEHRDIANEDATISLSAKELFSHFQNDETLATSNYLDKVIEIEGIITSIENDGVVLSGQIQVLFNTELMPKLENETALTIKGRCVGYDELLEMVKIDQATIISQEN